MSRKKTTFQTLVTRYLKPLERLAATPPGPEEAPDVSPQARAMLLLAHGLSFKEASRATGLTVCRVEYFRRRFIVLGPPGLEAAPSLKRPAAPRLPAFPQRRAA